MPLAKKSKRIHFYLLRLKRASWSELLYRIQEQIFTILLRLQPFRFFLERGLECCLQSNESGSLIKLPTLSNKEKCPNCKKIPTLNHNLSDLKKFEEKWHGTFFSDVKQEGGVPDIRAVWEPGRLQYLLIWELGGTQPQLSNDEKQKLRKCLLDWLSRNPFPFGAHYCSSMECGLRVIVFLYLILQKSFYETLYDKNVIYSAIYRHCYLISNRLSLYSSLGNHTVAEAVGLVCGGAVFRRNCRRAALWLSKGIALLEQESKHQILADGGPLEQSFSYHRFVLDLYWLAIDLLELNNLYDCEKIKERVRKGELFCHALKTGEESAPNFGDNDDGHALGKGIKPAAREVVEIQDETDLITVLPDSGYSVIRTKSGWRLIFDHGSLGMPPLYNHGHADALSFTLSFGDDDFLVDPGTYQYNGDQRFRRYFKGTRAHNTVIIDNIDQARQLTSFIWEEPYKVEWMVGHCKKSGCEFIKASHDGYCRLPEPVVHVRKILWNTKDNFITEDYFEGSGEHLFELHYHVHPDVEVVLQDRKAILKKNGKIIELKIGDGEITLLEGIDEPLCGWYSPAYGVLQKTKSIRVLQRGVPRDIRFLNELRVGNEN